MAKSQANRLDAGGRIDRARSISFKWNGSQYPAYAGDTLASALLANGITLVNRRPYGFDFFDQHGARLCAPKIGVFKPFRAVRFSLQ